MEKVILTGMAVVLFAVGCGADEAKEEQAGAESHLAKAYPPCKEGENPTMDACTPADKDSSYHPGCAPGTYDPASGGGAGSGEKNEPNGWEGSAKAYPPCEKGENPTMDACTPADKGADEDHGCAPGTYDPES